LKFHGDTGNSGNWFDLQPYVATGFVVATLNVRGQGGLSEDVGGHIGTTHWGHIIRGLDGDLHNLLFRHIFLDTAQLVQIMSCKPIFATMIHYISVKMKSLQNSGILMFNILHRVLKLKF
jgi:cephalosporin-C deacetylase